ncbi:hypothetical protein, partial [uncultured Caballeronia sp.]|uniref:hypothetical protein n=1 Tax=uncultured Caballeronia sp. TaxID=1827198 RepID=UPI0035CBE6C4
TESLRMAHESRLDPVAQRQYAMQARGMMREGKSALRMLLQLQARRRWRRWSRPLHRLHRRL